MKFRAVAVGVAALALAASGCGKAEPTVVAYVGDTSITERQLEQALDGISSTLQDGQQVSTEAVVDAMIHGEIASQIAASRGIAITDSQRDAFLRTTALVNLLDVPEAHEVIYDVADQQIVSTGIGGDAYLKATAAANVTLNPRYGVLDPQQKLIVSGKSGSLAKPTLVDEPR